MKVHTWLFALLAIAGITGGVRADEPLGTAFTYQGQMTEAGDLLDVDCDFEFSLWDAASGGVQVGSTDAVLALQVVDGLFTVQLDFGNGEFDGNARWLEIALRYPAGEGSYTTLTPRQEITGAPYAFHARTAGTVTGGVTGSGTAGYLAGFTGTDSVGNSTVYETGNGDIGIGTAVPFARLDLRGDNLSMRVSSPSDPMARWIDMLYHGSIGPLIRGGGGYNRLTLDAQWNGDPGIIVLGRDGDRVGVGTINPAAKLEVRAEGEPLLRAGDFRADYGNMSTHVLHAEYTGTGTYDATAVYGYSAPSQNYGIGGYFEGGYVGVQGQVYPSTIGNYYGARAGVNGGAGTNYGVYGYAHEGATNYGVYGIAGGGTTNYAGYFQGDVHVAGTLSKSAGSFKIDHPRDPENRYLSHAFVESPDMMNVYNGNAILDDQGRAVVVLPDYFDTLNEDFRYQLTPLGAAMPELHVADEISRNRFRIAGGHPGLKVSWQVTGIRRDPFAQQNRIEVEPYKQPEHRGLYLNPEAYGLPETRRIGEADRTVNPAGEER